jgi:hypothetical protein
MKRTLTLLIGLLLIGSAYADGLKPLTTMPDGYKPLSIKRTTYAPDPNSGNVGNALNLFMGVGGSLSVAIDYEFPVIDPNLTLGPQFIMGFPWPGGLGGLDLNGGVVARYYADWLIPNMPDQFDVFITSNTGIGFNTNSTGMYMYWGTMVGGRWNFSESMSMYAQVGGGYNSHFFNFGLSWKM